MNFFKSLLIATLMVGCQTEPIPSSRVPNKTDFGMAEKPILKPLARPSYHSETVTVPPLELRSRENGRAKLEEIVPGGRDPEFTPGKLCTKDDPDFKEFRYSEHIAYCARSVSKSEKLAVAKHYNIQAKDFKKYEFDHFIPLGIGGANSIENLWPQPRSQKNSEFKNKLELKVFEGMRDGTLTQAEAVKLIMEWKPKD